MKPICLINGPFFHHLDHLAPIAHYLNCPLLLDDPLTYEMAKKYYPGVDIYFKIVHLEELAKHYNCLIVSTKFAREELSSLYASMNIHHMRFCFAPHGQSDKGMSHFNMRSIVNQDIALVYGETQKNRVLQLPKEALPNDLIVMGNCRLAYYEKYKILLDQLVETTVFKHFSKKQPTILYAPTWNDYEHATSFFDHWHKCIENIPDNYNLIIKLHPFLEKDHPGEAYRALSFHLSRPNIQVVLEMPLIYPLLSKIDAYVGDYSAIGYDYLYFNRPMYFLSKTKVALYKCGEQIENINQINIENRQNNLMKKRNDSYKKAFDDFSEHHFINSFFSLSNKRF